MTPLAPLRRFVAELRRRKVAAVAVGYVVIAWGVIEVSSTVLGMLAAPLWIAQLILGVLALGFPIALVLAWIFDVSLHGIVRTDDVATPAPAYAKRALALTGLASVLALSGFALLIRPARSSDVTFTQLTNFADAATAPALSPDGKTLAFLKGYGYFGNSASRAQVYIKRLPDGEAVQLTNTPNGKATPAFSPDGARVVFSSAQGNFDWHTHGVSVHGGSETKLLPNASGLVWIDSTHVLYAQVDRGEHMGLRRSRLDRADARDIYWPTNDHGMAHRAAVSPDRKWALVSEMDTGIWLPCRLVPLAGSSGGKQVGPPNSQCTYAAWSPDGRWMYFSANAGGLYHLWRQRFPKGEPEQITYGPTEEEGIAVDPDGRSLITSAGVRHNAIWLLDNDGNRQVSSEEFAFGPVATRDGRSVYYLRRAGAAKRAYDIGFLTSIELETNAREELFAEQPMVHFDLSADDRTIVFVSGSRDPAAQGIYIAPLDRNAPPRRVFDGDTERAFFDPAGNIYFARVEGHRRFLHRLSAPDYAESERLHDEPARYIFSITPNGEWVLVVGPGSGEGLRQYAISTRGEPARVICSLCGGGAGPARVFAPALSWTRDGRALLVSTQFARLAGMAGLGNTILVPVTPDKPLPDELPAGGITSADDYRALPGARDIAQPNVFPGATAGQLLFYESTTIRNLYRVTLPR